MAAGHGPVCIPAGSPVVGQDAGLETLENSGGNAAAQAPDAYIRLIRAGRAVVKGVGFADTALADIPRALVPVARFVAGFAVRFDGVSADTGHAVVVGAGVAVVIAGRVVRQVGVRFDADLARVLRALVPVVGGLCPVGEAVARAGPAGAGIVLRAGVAVVAGRIFLIGAVNAVRAVIQVVGAGIVVVAAAADAADRHVVHVPALVVVGHIVQGVEIKPNPERTRGDLVRRQVAEIQLAAGPGADVGPATIDTVPTGPVGGDLHGRNIPAGEVFNLPPLVICQDDVLAGRRVRDSVPGRIEPPVFPGARVVVHAVVENPAMCRRMARLAAARGGEAPEAVAGELCRTLEIIEVLHRDAAAFARDAEALPALRTVRLVGVFADSAYAPVVRAGVAVVRAGRVIGFL